MIQHAPDYNLTISDTKRRVRRTSRRKRAGNEGSHALLRHLCDGAGVVATTGLLVRPIVTLCCDSSRVTPGALYFASPDRQGSEAQAIHEAFGRGAAAVVTERADLEHPRALVVRVRDVRHAMAVIARRFYEAATDRPTLIGITGSHGKTTVAHWLHHLLKGEENRVGLLSSEQYDLGARVVPSRRTTPEPLDLHNMLAQMRQGGCEHAVMEVSARGLAMKRLAGLPVDVAVFLNLGEEHADGYGGREACYRMKADFLTGGNGPLPRVAVVNLDDPCGLRLIQEVPEDVRVVTFGRSRLAEIRATEILEGDSGAVVRIEWPEGSARVRIRQLGAFAVSNLLAAVSAAWASGFDLQRVLPRAVAFPGVPGRMEEVPAERRPFRIFVDGSRSPESTRNTLRAARELCTGSLLVVFGCRGNGDSARSHKRGCERAAVVRAVQCEADFAWGTSDSPGNEPLGEIFNEMYDGVSDAERVVFVNDRRRAIALALDTAAEGDVVVLLGKGNEAFEYVGDAALPFDDRIVARELLSAREVEVARA